MPSRTLESALREHAKCGHAFTITDRFRATHEPVQDHEWSVLLIDDDRTATERGSALFHLHADALLAIPGHVRTPLHVTDEEYAGFTNG